eukprot:8780123-Pyramimonas_sp.AAC.1
MSQQPLLISPWKVTPQAWEQRAPPNDSSHGVAVAPGCGVDDPVALGDWPAAPHGGPKSDGAAFP